jgi:hypothetical protein
VATHGRDNGAPPGGQDFPPSMKTTFNVNLTIRTPAWKKRRTRRPSSSKALQICLYQYGASAPLSTSTSPFGRFDGGRQRNLFRMVTQAESPLLPPLVSDGERGADGTRITVP